MENIRGTHTSPGYYDKITELTYKANSLGITTAGLVGETLKGPAFDPTWITSKQEFADYFGGTSAEKYRYRHGAGASCDSSAGCGFHL